MPNSCVRWLTENAITPAMPAAVMTSASRPNSPISATTTRRGVSVERPDVGERAEVRDRQVRVVRVRRRADRRAPSSGRLQSVFTIHVVAEQRRLMERHVDLRAGRAIELLAHVGDDADDR